MSVDSCKHPRSTCQGQFKDPLPPESISQASHCSATAATVQIAEEQLQHLVQEALAQQQNGAFDRFMSALETMNQLLPDWQLKYNKAPSYGCTTLKKDSTTTNIADWIATIEDAYLLRPDATDQQKIQWSLIKLDPVLQRKWQLFADQCNVPRDQAT